MNKFKNWVWCKWFHYSMSRRTNKVWRKYGRLPQIQVGKDDRVNWSDVTTWMFQMGYRSPCLHMIACVLERQNVKIGDVKISKKSL